MIFNPIVVGGGIELPTLSNPGSAADLRNGKQLLGPDGQPITGTLKDVTLATPTISAASNGTITATVNQQSAGYIGTGSKSGTLKLSSAHDSDFIPANIKSGVNIFGVTGTYQPPTPPAVDIQVDCFENGVNFDYRRSALYFTLTKNCSELLSLYFEIKNYDFDIAEGYYPSVDNGDVIIMCYIESTGGARRDSLDDQLPSINGNKITIPSSTGRFDDFMTEILPDNTTWRAAYVVA